MSEQLKKLAKPFPASVVKQKPGSFAAAYVSHSEVTQSLLGIVGPYSTEVKQVLYSPEGKVEGIVLALTVTIDGAEGLHLRRYKTCFNAARAGLASVGRGQLLPLQRSRQEGEINEQ